MPTLPFRALFSDIGGVLGSNGWDADLRQRVCLHFDIPLQEIEPRHHLMFDSYERGFLSFETYLQRVFFASPRAFTLEEVRRYTYDASAPWPANIALLKEVKRLNHLKLGLISNEGQGITEHRVTKFGLRDLADFFVISHFVHMRKPDPEIWRLALQLAQSTTAETIYIDDREMFTEVAFELGFTTVHHTSLEQTRDALSCLGLEVPKI